jgi:hypothetical protein
MRYPCYRVAQGRQLLAAMRGDTLRAGPKAQPEMRLVKHTAAEDDVGIERILEEARDILLVHQAKRLRDGGLDKDEVEGMLAVALHGVMSELPPQVLGDPDFWRYVSLGMAPDFVAWRDGENCSPASYGLQSGLRIPDCVPLRMFNRAHIGQQVSSILSTDVAEACRLGGADFWQSHVLRVQNRFDSRVVAALIAAMQDGRLPRAEEMRLAAKKIRQERSNLVLELMEQGESINVVNSLVNEISTGKNP